MVRPPAVAGRFYPSNADDLACQIDEFAPRGSIQEGALGCMVPHAGYVYSGAVAGAVYSSLQIPRRCVLLGPRHFPRGSAMAIVSSGSWQTPFGEAQIDADLASELVRACPYLREDPIAHEREHSLEVQIPFLQRLVGDFRFVPIVLATDRYPMIKNLGLAVAHVIRACGEPVLVIASSDMNHYESDSVTRAKDHRAVECIQALDPRGLYDRVRTEGITMCGYAAAVAMLIALIELGAKRATLMRYATSGDITGDRDEVVGYAGMVVR